MTLRRGTRLPRRAAAFIRNACGRGLRGRAPLRTRDQQARPHARAHRPGPGGVRKRRLMATVLRQGQPCTAPLNNSKGRPTSALTSAEAQPFDLAGRVADQVRGDDVAALLARTGEPFLLVTARHWRARCSSKRGEPRFRAMVRRTASGFADDGRPLPVHLRVLARLELDAIDLLNRGSRRSRQSAKRCTGGTRAAGEPLRRPTPQPAARRGTTFQDAGGGVALTCLHAAAGRGDRWGRRARRRISVRESRQPMRLRR